MKDKYILTILVVFLVTTITGLVVTSTPEGRRSETLPRGIDTVTIEGHQYVTYTSFKGSGIVHSASFDHHSHKQGGDS